MLSKKNRLSKKEVNRIFKRGKIFRNRFFSLRLEKEEKNVKNSSSFSAIVPISLSKKSSKRNSLKRKIREALRGQISGIKPGFKGIIIALPGSLEKSYKEIEEEVKKLLEKAQIRQFNNPNV